MPQVQRQQMNANMQRAVVIGLGGTGAQVIRRFRRLILDRFGSFERLPIVKFLYIDTDPKTIREVTSEVDQDIRLSKAELVDIQVANATDLYRGIDDGNYPQYDWFTLDRLRAFANISEGAGTVRQLGRLCFWQHYPEIQEALAAQIRSVNANTTAAYMQAEHGLTVDPGINVHIIAGLAGGTGSGCFLDMAYLARKVVAGLGVAAAQQFAGYLVLPSAYADLAGTNALPNGYAALKELNYHSYIRGAHNKLAALYGRPEWKAQYTIDPGSLVEYPDTPPFNFTYLLDSSNEHVQLHRSDIFAMLARSLFHDFALEFAGFKRSLRANIQMQLTSNDHLDCPTRFMSFGQSAIYFPLREVQQVLAHQLALRAVQQWMDRTAKPVSVLLAVEGKEVSSDEAAQAITTSLTQRAESEDVKGAVRGSLIQSFLPSHGFRAVDVLSAVLADDKTRLVDVPYQLRENEKHRWINERWPRDAFQGHLTNAWQRWRGDFNDEGPDPTAWGEQIRWMVANRESALALYRRTIYEQAMADFHDPNRGPAWALSFVQQMRGPLGTLRERFLEEANNAVAIAESLGDVYLINAARQSQGPSLSAIIERRIGEEYQLLDQLVRDRVGYLWKGEERLRSQAYAYLTWCAHWCRARVEERGRRLAADMCGSLITGLDETERQIRETARVLATIQARVTQLAREWAQKGATTENVGKLLYDADIVGVLERKVAELRGDVYDPRVVGEKALRDVQATLEQIHEEDVPRLLEALMQAANDALGDLSETDLTETRFAAHDLLDAKFHDQNALDAALNDTIQQGSPFVRLLNNPPGGNWTPGGQFPAGLLETRGAGIRGGYQQNDQDVERVRVLTALNRAGWNPANEISSISDSEQILFVQECGGFPLRALDGLADMKREYANHQSNPQNPPLHIVRNEMAERFPDLFPPNPQDLERGLTVRSVGMAFTLVVPRDFPSPNEGGRPVRLWAYERPIPETAEIERIALGDTPATVGMKLTRDLQLAKELEAAIKSRIGAANAGDKKKLAKQLVEYLKGRAKQAVLDEPALPAESNPSYTSERDRVVKFMREQGLSAS